MAAFPDSFVWGVASSSTGVEGAAPASDWAAWEAAGHAPPSGDGNGFATRHREDHALLAAHGLRTHRLTLEWARIEPSPGQHDDAAVERYLDILRTARDEGVDVWACLHHLSLPGWFSIDEHGFTDTRSRTYSWPRHVDFVAETFGDLIAGWVPVHEPTAFATRGWLDGLGPPGRRADAEGFAEALEAVHLAAFDAARRLRETGRPVASSYDLSPVTTRTDTASGGHVEAEACRALLDRILFGCWIEAMRDGILHVPGRGPIEQPWFQEAFDLVGFTYTHALAVDRDGTTSPYPADLPVSPLGYAPWSEGLAVVLHRVAEELPDRALLVAGHGIGTVDDGRRHDFLRESLGFVAQAVADGIDLRGFFHLGAVDGYEWQAGSTLPFGIIDRDRAPKGSAALLRDWATGVLP